MERDNARLIALVEERLQKLESLAHETKAAQEACVALDLEALRNHDSKKERLCAEIRRLDGEIAGVVGNAGGTGALRGALAAGEGLEVRMGAEEARKLEGLMEASEAARAEVAELNRVYAAFLARSRNTLKVMMNVVSHCLGVYPVPGRPGSAGSSFERST